MTLKELETQLLALTPTEKAEAIQILTQTLSQSSHGIRKTPGVCGGDAYIANTHISVWLLIESRHFGISEAQLLVDYPDLIAADLVNAWAYADAHPTEIEEAIRKNEFEQVQWRYVVGTDYDDGKNLVFGPCLEKAEATTLMHRADNILFLLKLRGINLVLDELVLSVERLPTCKPGWITEWIQREAIK